MAINQECRSFWGAAVFLEVARHHSTGIFFMSETDLAIRVEEGEVLNPPDHTIQTILVQANRPLKKGQLLTTNDVQLPQEGELVD